MDVELIFDGLNPEQRRAVEAVRGPVCILAGAGSGKTTTITRRIANQVATGAFEPGEILAVTFTDKAAGEMKSRLAQLDVEGVRASTFHSAALGQLHHFGSAPPGRVLVSKAMMLRTIGNTLPRPYRFRPAVDLATEIEWAKNRRLTPDTYLTALEREPPIPAELMQGVFLQYERRKEDGGFVDFEDLLERAIRMYDEDQNALTELRERHRAFTVDEYQDVNMLQQNLLERWLGNRDELCAVGDDYQAIYAFTGATPTYLLTMPSRFPNAHVVRLERNYRSTPEVLEVANRLVPRLGGAAKTLRAAREPGAATVLRGLAGPPQQADLIVERVRALHGDGVPYEEMALLARTNARLADFEEVFADAKVPFQGAALLAREGARRLLKAVRSHGGSPAAATIRHTAYELGMLDKLPDRLGEREVTRQQDLARIVRLADEFDDGTTDVVGFVAYLQERFAPGSAGRGVHLLTYHGAKGLEFDAVFLPRLEERELPSRLAKKDADIAEERRLFYVGMTRARHHLTITWSGKPSRFLAELGIEVRPPRPAEPDDPLYRALKRWRLDRAKADEIPAFVVFHDTTLAAIAARRPRTAAELATISGVGPMKLERYAAEVLSVLAQGGDEELEHDGGIAAHASAA